MLSPLAAVVFDLGGTLTCPGPPPAAAEPWRRYATAVDPARRDEWVPRLLAAEHEAWLACRDHSRSFTFARLLEIAGVPYDPRGVAAYRACWHPHTRVAPDARDVLLAIRAAGLATGLLSNTVWPAAWHLATLDEGGLGDLFDVAVFTSDLDVAKPHPEAFHEVLRRLGVDDPGRAVYVGDRVFEDVTGARAAGMRSVLLPATSVPPEHATTVVADPDARITTLSDLLPVLRSWSPRRHRAGG